jgi:hypothetical protein
MSLASMNAAERASYFIGQAVLRQLEQAPADLDAIREIAAVSRWIEHRFDDRASAITLRRGTTTLRRDVAARSIVVERRHSVLIAGRP